MKSYTDLEQSKKLAEILPIESADMAYWKKSYLPSNYAVAAYQIEKLQKGFEQEDIEYIPCWSLAALFSVIPQEIFGGEYIINITEGIDNRWVLTYDHFENRNHSYYSLSIGAYNLVDACVSMIEKLHELNFVIMEDPNKYLGSVFVWEEQKVKEIMQDIVDFTKQSDNNIKWK